MSELIAKPVVKNKFWVVEDQGQRVATIQAVEDGSIVYVHDDLREKYPSIKILSKHHNIKFSSAAKTAKENNKQVYGFPINGKSFNAVYDIKRKLPIYTKTDKSKSQYCAGYFLIKFNHQWTKSFCPKSITINRYPFFGPFKTENEMIEKYKELSNAKT